MTLCTAWITGADLVAQRPDIVSTVAVAVSGEPATAPVYDLAAQAASETLFALSGRRFPGVCAVTLRPTARPPSWTIRDWSTYLMTLSGVGYSMSWGYCYGGGHDRCDVDDRRAIDLGVFPLVDVTEVLIDGVALDRSAYDIADSRLLVRTDDGVWPTCQDWTRPATEPGTFQVTAEFGDPAPAAGVLGAIALAVEYAKAGVGKDTQLPSGVTRIVRQGVEWGYFDPVQIFRNGLTGIPLADAFIVAVNPHRQKSRPRVLSPDTVKSHRIGTTTTPGGT